jgi:type I restriction enzyme, S subunit
MVTEAGLVELGSVTKWLSGGTPNRAVGHYWSGDIPWISASTLKEAEVSSSDQCVTKEAVSWGSKMAPVCFNQDVKALIPSANVYPKFLTYSILGRQTQLLDLVSSAGNTAGVLDTKLVQAFKIWLPDVNEQRAIVTALSDVDALIAGLEKLIAKKRDLKQAAIQQLLTGQTRLPGFSGEWDSKMLGDIAHIQKGQLITTETLVAGSIPVIAGGKKPAYFHNKPNRLGKTITVSASGASAGYVAFHRSAIFASDCSTISEAKSYCIEFLYFSLQLQQETIYSAQTGGAQPHIQPKDLSPLPVLLPIALDEQQTIAKVLCDMEDELAALESRLANTRDLKQGMMQELLTGRTRLV